MTPLEAQVHEAIAILEGGTDYERLHVAAILRNGLRAQGSEPQRFDDAKDRKWLIGRHQWAVSAALALWRIRRS